MLEEIDNLHKTRTLDLISLPAGKNVINYKGYIILRQTNGSLECYIVRLMAKNFSQNYNIDHEETLL